MRAFGGFASKIAPRISRGIGQDVTKQNARINPPIILYIIIYI